MGRGVKEVQIKASAKMIVTSVSMPTPSVNPISLFSLRDLQEQKTIVLFYPHLLYILGSVILRDAFQILLCLDG